MLAFATVTLVSAPRLRRPLPGNMAGASIQHRQSHPICSKVGPPLSLSLSLSPPFPSLIIFSQLCAALLCSDAFSEFKELVAVQLQDTIRDFKMWLLEHGADAAGFVPAASSCIRISSHIPWDLCGVSFQECASEDPLMAAIFNVDGRRELFM